MAATRRCRGAITMTIGSIRSQAANHGAAQGASAAPPNVPEWKTPTAPTSAVVLATCMTPQRQGANLCGKRTTSFRPVAAGLVIARWRHGGNYTRMGDLLRF